MANNNKRQEGQDKNGSDQDLKNAISAPEPASNQMREGGQMAEIKAEKKVQAGRESEEQKNNYEQNSRTLEAQGHLHLK